MANDETVKVVVRCRPLNAKEKADGRAQLVQMSTREGQVILPNPKADGAEAPKTFTYDQVYDADSEQRLIFEVTAMPIIDSTLEGYNGTIFAYGQTGTGKSFTMMGAEDPVELRGIIPNTFNYIMERIQSESGSKEFLVRASYLEIYNEDIRDLLGKDHTKKLQLKENKDKGVYVKDLVQIVIKSVKEFEAVLAQGHKNRSVGATAMNQDSSRSHSIFTITIECVEKYNAKETKDTEGHIRVGKLNLVDLAGSERQSKTGATGDRLKEGIKINLSLTALGNVISSLVDSKSGHIPYRDSKLTRLLQDSLGGNTKTVMIANIGPADWNYDETLSTLRYANRAKNIKNKPKINEDPKDAMLREYQEEIKKLREALEARGGGGTGAGGKKKSGHKGVVEQVVDKVVVHEMSQEQVNEIKQRMAAELEAKMREDLSKDAIAKARAEAEANARAALEHMIADKNSTEEQKEQAAKALSAQQQEMDAIAREMEKEVKAQKELEGRLQEMEGKVIHGGENLLEKAEMLKQQAKNLKVQEEVMRRKQEEMKRRMVELEDQKMDIQQKFGSMEEEITVKTRKLKKLYGNYQSKKSEINDLNQQFQEEREALLDDVRVLTQQIKLKDLIIASFIPPEYQQRVMEHCHFNEYEESWMIDMIQYAGNPMRAHKELAAAEADAEAFAMNNSGRPGDHVYYTYKAVEEELGITHGHANAGSSSGGNSPMRASRTGGSDGGARPASGRRTANRAGGRAATDIGSLRDNAHQVSAGGGDDAAYPTARGLVKESSAVL